MPGTRRKARTVALQSLYEVDCAGHDAEETVSRILEERGLLRDGAGFARQLVRGVMANKGEIDTIIQAYAPAWPVEQMAVIDRNILRLAIFEILFNNKVPPKAVINEAVELAKAFGSDNSAKFVNGVLGSVLAFAQSRANSAKPST